MRLCCSNKPQCGAVRGTPLHMRFTPYSDLWITSNSIALSLLRRGVVINYPTRSRLALSIQNTAPFHFLMHRLHHKTSLDVRASQTNREEISYAQNMPTRTPKIAIMRPYTLERMNIAPERPSHGDDASYERRATYPTPKHSIETRWPFFNVC